MSQRKIHFIGIGGAGMSGLAHILLAQGVAVSGSDLAETSTTRRLARMGARVYIGHDAAHLRAEQPTDIVISSAVPADNPELRYGREQSIPILFRAQMLARLMEEHGQQRIAVAGTHGKTTVTSMIGLIMEHAGTDPTIVVGGELDDIGSNAKLGHGPHFVAEADESDRSFLHLRPDVAVVTNVDADHMENYSSIEEIEATFRRFLAGLPADGLAVLCLDSARAAALAPLHCPHTTYGLDAAADYSARDVELLPFGSTFVVTKGGAPVGRLTLRVPGAHNIANALAAVAVADTAGVDFARIAAALAVFRGAKRRFDVLGQHEDVIVVDDYAHHPTEIEATLAALRNMERRTIAVFQPHRYTRTQHFFHELAKSFGEADHIVLTDIFAARERPIVGIDAERLAAAMRQHVGDKVTVVRHLDAVPGFLLGFVRPGDVVVTMGAGNVRRAGEQFLTLLSTEPALVAHLTPPADADANRSER